jgi:hypothetical protein
MPDTWAVIDSTNGRHAGLTHYNRVVIETGSKRMFASAIDWPGWCRSARTEDEALEALRAYADRYRRVADAAGEDGVTEASGSFDVVERVAGTAVTDFGVPEVAAEVENGRMSDEECERQIALLSACWQVFDEISARVSEELRKGPRGGGRDRTKLIAHTLEAERGYARRIGVMTAKGSMSLQDGLAAHRLAVCDAIRTTNASGDMSTKWPIRYYIRRATWHVMDHAWEMEDKDLTGQAQ